MDGSRSVKMDANLFFIFLSTFCRQRKEEMAAATRRVVAVSPLCVAPTAAVALERTRLSSVSQ